MEKKKYKVNDVISFTIDGKVWTFKVKETFLYLVSYPNQKTSQASFEDIDNFFKQFTDKGKSNFLKEVYGYRGDDGKFPAWRTSEDVSTIVEKIVNKINEAINIKENKCVFGITPSTKQQDPIKDIPNTSNMTATNPFGNLVQGLDFGKIEDDSIAMSLKGIAFKDPKTGSYKAYDSKKNRIIDVMNLAFQGMPLFKMPVKKAKIQKGDVLIINGEYVVFDSWADNSMKVINPIKGENAFLIEEVNLFGIKFYTKVVNLFGKMGGKGSNMMNMMLMSQMFGGGSTGSTMFGGGDMLQTMMMMKMLDGGDMDLGLDFDIFDDEEEA